ncbi:glycoside hydrolase family protein [Gilliamella intestini]|uniref:Lysozyme n=1 Tax=Gilliamella intestini TaxID=1798183 RepID=A0A1C4DM08_9GAMM|nr:hypothetical protein [Gilliamella intestini]SCC32342.1 hypothetical protein GA0061080_10843 [Gilliamella intestini]
MQENIRKPQKKHQLTPKPYTKGTTIGIGGFKNSTVVKMINNPKGSYAYNSLEEAWLSWSNSQGKFNQGVNNRRRSEYYLFKNNKYTTYSHLDGEYKEI